MATQLEDLDSAFGPQEIDPSEEAAKRDPDPALLTTSRHGRQPRSCLHCETYDDVYDVFSSSLPADPIETSARPDRTMYQKRMTPGMAINVVSR